MLSPFQTSFIASWPERLSVIIIPVFNTIKLSIAYTNSYSQELFVDKLKKCHHLDKTTSAYVCICSHNKCTICSQVSSITSYRNERMHCRNRRYNCVRFHPVKTVIEDGKISLDLL